MVRSPAMVIHRGGCHCGAVRFEVEAPATIDVNLAVATGAVEVATCR